MEAHRGIDLHNRPGAPMVKDVGAHAPEAELARQRPQGEVLHEPGQGMTPVFGSGPVPSGISGMLRRFAYTFPDYRVKRWLLLLVADRVDGVEQLWRRRVPLEVDGGNGAGNGGRRRIAW